MAREVDVRGAIAVSLLVALGACRGESFTQPMMLGGKQVSAEALNAGKEGYILNCYACHGMKGDGKGPSSPGLRPPPRDFTLGMFKFVSVRSGQLPTDEDLRRIVKGGLHGTAMLAWDVSDKEIESIIQYIKTFATRWQEESPGEVVAMSPDPYGAAKKDEALAKGAKIYHVKAQCASCHPAYVARDQYAAYIKEAQGPEAEVAFREDMYEPILKDSDYGVKLLPPDFWRSNLRAGTSLTDLYRTIACGVGGAAMPSWKDALPEDELWAMVYYVKSLADVRETPEAVALRQRLDSQPAWQSPAPQSPPPAQ